MKLIRSGFNHERITKCVFFLLVVQFDWLGKCRHLWQAWFMIHLNYDIMKNNGWKISWKSSCIKKEYFFRKNFIPLWSMQGEKEEEKSSNSMMHLSTISLIRALLENLPPLGYIRLMLKKSAYFCDLLFNCKGYLVAVELR